MHCAAIIFVNLTVVRLFPRYSIAFSRLSRWRARVQFATYNFGGSGALSETELMALTSDLSQAVTLDDLSEAIDALNSTEGDIDFDAFAAWWENAAPKSVRNVIVSDWFLMRQLYKKYDKDDSGKLERDEVAQLVQDHGIELDQTELDTVVQMLDKDGDGLVGFEEFERWWQSVK